MNGAEDIRRLQTIPGVGDKTALAFTAYVGDGKRFNNGDEVANYLGLVPRVDPSGTINKYGHITKKKKISITAIARKMAKLMYLIMKNQGEEYKELPAPASRSG